MKIKWYILSLTLVVAILFLSYLGINKNNKDLLTNKISKNFGSSIAIMVETGFNSNEYKVLNSDDWPGSDYIFNEEKSACENGGKITWNRENKSISLATNSSNKCYAYFDKSETLANYVKNLYDSKQSVGNGELNYHDGNIKDYIFYKNDELIAKLSVSPNHPEYKSVDDIIIYHDCPIEFNEDGECYDSTNDEYLDYDYYTLVYDDDNIQYYSYEYEDLLRKAIDDGYITTDKTILDAADYSYRYSGEDPNNYVCLGKILTQATKEKLDSGKGLRLQAGQCDSVKNLYRIIGIFKNEKEEYQVKLIKSEYLTEQELRGTVDEETPYGDDSYPAKAEIYYNISHVKDYEKIHTFHWNTNYDDFLYVNLWAQDNNKGSLNNELNRYYLTNTLAKWQNDIAEATWYIGGIGIEDYNAIPKEIYNAEMNLAASGDNPAPQTTAKAKIGLMYASEYRYALIKDTWSKEDYNLYSEDYNQNWLHNGLDYGEWLITRYNSENYEGIYINSYGGLGITDESVADMTKGVRPVFYLNANVMRTYGDGTFNKPYAIS